MHKKWIFLAGIAMCLVIAAWAYYQYQKPRIGVASIAADYTMQSEKLFAHFYTNEEDANDKYTGKIVEITGTVQDIQQTQNATIILFKGGETGDISCQLSKPLTASIKNNSTITIKGKCTGYLMDVNLVDAIVIE